MEKGIVALFDRFLLCRAVSPLRSQAGGLTFTGQYVPVGNPPCVAFVYLR
jgi:hypothetical protein